MNVPPMVSELNWYHNNIYVCFFLGGYLLAYNVYTPHKHTMPWFFDDAFPIFNIHVRVSDWVDLSKCDFSTDNENYNKDTKPLWCDFFLDSEVQPNQKLHSVRG